MRFSILLVVGVITFASCSRNPQTIPPKIPEDRFTDYYAASLIIVQEEKLLGHDSLWMKHRIDSLRRSYNLKERDIQNTIDFYHDNLSRWREFNSKVIKKIEEIQRKNE